MKKSFLILPIILVVIVVSSLLYRSAAIANRRYHIFCESLHLGMNKDSVVDTLEQYGSIDYNISTFGNGTFEIYMGYVDPQIVDQKTYILTFYNGRLSGVSVPASFWEFKGIGSVKAVCDP
jgi:hypothetical protein